MNFGSMNVWSAQHGCTGSIKQVATNFTLHKTKIRVYCTYGMQEPPRTPYANCSDAGAWQILRFRNDWFGSAEARCVIQHFNHTSCCPRFLITICSIISEVYYVLMLQLAKICWEAGLLLAKRSHRHSMPTALAFRVCKKLSRTMHSMLSHCL